MTGAKASAAGLLRTFCLALVLALPVSLAVLAPPVAAQQATTPPATPTTPSTPPPATTPAETPPAPTPPAQTGPATPPAATPTTPVAPKVAAPAGRLTISKGDANRGTLDYTGWEGIAERAERTLADPETPAATLEFLRTRLVDWRAAFVGAQNANAARIATLREQIAALGPAPEGEATEAVEIAQRRQALSDQLIRLQAPGLAADEAYRRADGLIREIDRTLREQETDRLLQLWPSPANPANWPAAIVTLRDISLALWTEGAARWKGDGREAFFDSLPLLVALTVIGLALILRGMALLQRLVGRLPQPATRRGRRVADFLASFIGQVVLPTLGSILITAALVEASFTGPQGTVLIDLLPGICFTAAMAIWLGARVFPHAADADSAADMPVVDMELDRRAEGRFHTALLGLLLGVQVLLETAIDPLKTDEAALAVLSMPTLVAVAVLLLRLGQLLRRHARPGQAEESAGFAVRLVGLLGRAAIAVGIAAPVLGAVGYVAAASAIVYPAALSLGLVASLFVLLRLVSDLYGLATRSDAADQDGLIPVLIGFAISIASLPLFALIWGARPEDLTELWQRFLGGFQLGATQVSPTDFLLFGAIFLVGYTLTRLVQGALRTTVLPRTTLDPGGQTAVVSGTGYLGIILSGLLAINFAGIDLSGLAIVAGALSLGIGFGLQNIVSNFVSGLILLIERPVSEGDWIEVGTVSGIVKSISVRSTRIQTFDRSDVIVPNADLVAGRVTNWTRFNLSGRVVVPVTVAHGSDARKVERILRGIAEAQPLVVLTPPPIVALMGFNNDGLQFELRMILRDVNFSVTVRSEVNHQILERFEAEGVYLRPPPAEPAAAPLPAGGPAPAPAALPKPARARRESTDALPKAGDTPAF